MAYICKGCKDEKTPCIFSNFYVETRRELDEELCPIGNYASLKEVTKE